MNIKSFKEVKELLSNALRYESYSPTKDIREVEWRDKDTHELIAEGCADPETFEITLNEEAGVTLFDGHQGEMLFDLGQTKESNSQDFIDTSALSDRVYLTAKPTISRIGSRRRI